MSTLISCHGLAKAYGAEPLFEDLSLQVTPEDRLGIIGANGSGKSTLLRILAGLEEPDQGERMAKKGLRIQLVAQEPLFEEDLTVAGALTDHLAAHPVDPTEDAVAQGVRVDRLLSRMGFDEPQAPVATLSGGWHKRLAIARAMVCEPELLILDEPTNHLDLESILWLESQLQQGRCAVIVVSHDRAFLEAVAGRVAEVDRRFPGGLLIVSGGYDRFVEQRAEALAARAKQKDTLVNKVRREQEWLQRGPKARSTKAQGRIKEAEVLMAELARMRDQESGTATRIDLNATGRKSKRLMVLKGVAKAMGGRPLFADLNLLLRPGMRLGLLGRNGSGKTTLLKLMAGALAPDAGTIKGADGLRVVTFEQKRDALDPAQSLKQVLAPEGDAVIYREQSVHVVSWARRFSFSAEQLEQPVSRLSGGERAKVAIAQLMLQPADLLLLDEPTNDLDLPTLQVLEESLLAFPGAVVLVTHDRAMLDRVSTVMLGLDGQGDATVLADTAQWTAMLRAAAKAESGGRDKPKERAQERPKRKKGLSYLEKREFEGMEEAILAAEATLQTARAAAADPAIATDAAALTAAHQTLAAAEQAVQGLYDRWAALEGKQIS